MKRPEKDETVRDIIEEVKAEMCQYYCKWPEKWDRDAEGVELEDSPLCLNCPMGRLG